MLFTNKTIFILVNFFLILNLINSIDQQKPSILIESILKNGKQGFLKTYLELPDSDLFINSDVIYSIPAKFLNYSSSIRNVFNDWDENEFISNLTSSFIYANMIESTSKNGFIESKTNLARFLKQKDQYSYETSIYYQMPLFIKYLVF
jgi:hypothetical protein